MSINEEKLRAWIEQTDKKLARLEANQMAIINGDFWDTNTTPKEPLIKDEKIRKAVRAWAEANDIDPERYYDTNVKFDFLEHRLKWIETSIEFNDIKGLENLEDGESYTIDELCGEPVERDFEETRPTGGEE